MNPEILALPPEQVGLVCDLFSSVYGHSVSVGQWDWKYHQGPRLGSINLAARTQGGEWVGHIGASVFPGHDHGKSLPMAHVCDIMVKRQDRGGLGREGVYPRLVSALQYSLSERFPGVFAYGFPGVRPFRLGERMGFYRSIYRCHSFRISHAASFHFSTFLWSAVQADWDMDRLDRLWLRHIRGDFPATVCRSGAYMGWRYRDHPERPYRLWILKNLFREVGWLVTRNQPSGEICIVDALLPRPDAADAACAALWRAAAIENPAPVAVTGWLSDVRQGRQETPIVATEFKVGTWHADVPAPQFHPGDTDVY